MSKRNSNVVNNDSINWGTVRIIRTDETSFRGVQNALQNERFFLKNERDAIQEDWNDKTRRFLPGEREKEWRNNHGRKITEMTEKAQNAARQQVNEFVTKKRAQITTMIATPPTAAQTTLLQALTMRGDNVTDTELNALVPVFFSNYQAMKTLQTVGNTAGVDVHIPVSMECGVLLDTLDKAEEYLYRACDVIGTPMLTGTEFSAFYMTDPNNPNFIQDPTYREFTEIFDTVPQMNEVQATKERLTPTEQMRLDYYMSSVAGSEDEGQIYAQVEKVLTEHPETEALFKFSEQYWAEAETVKQTREKAQENNTGEVIAAPNPADSTVPVSQTD